DRILDRAANVVISRIDVEVSRSAESGCQRRQNSLRDVGPPVAIPDVVNVGSLSEHGSTVIRDSVPRGRFTLACIAVGISLWWMVFGPDSPACWQRIRRVGGYGKSVYEGSCSDYQNCYQCRSSNRFYGVHSSVYYVTHPTEPLLSGYRFLAGG